jgi:hypothetical protein
MKPAVIVTDTSPAVSGDADMSPRFWRIAATANANAEMRARSGGQERSVTAPV